MFHSVTGLTGGMGSGKSTVSAMLPQLGYSIVDADLLTRKVHQNPAVCAQLAAAFGSDILTHDEQSESISRPLLAKRAFASESARKMLNDIMQPALKNAAKHAIQNAQSPVILDAPLLFEAGWHDLVKQTVVVISPLQSRIQHILSRDNLSLEHIQTRINAQFTDEQRCAYAQYFIYNCADLQTLKRQVLRIFA